MTNDNSVRIVLPLPLIMSSELNSSSSFGTYSAYILGEELIVGVMLAIFNEEHDHLSECVDNYLDNENVNIYKDPKYQECYDRVCKMASDMYLFLSTVINDNAEITKLRNKYYYLEDVSVIPGGLLVRLVPPDYNGDDFTEHVLTFNELPY